MYLEDYGWRLEKRLEMSQNNFCSTCEHLKIVLKKDTLHYMCRNPKLMPKPERDFVTGLMHVVTEVDCYSIRKFESMYLDCTAYEERKSPE